MLLVMKDTPGVVNPDMDQNSERQIIRDIGYVNILFEHMKLFQGVTDFTKNLRWKNTNYCMKF